MDWLPVIFRLIPQLLYVVRRGDVSDNNDSCYRKAQALMWMCSSGKDCTSVQNACSPCCTFPKIVSFYKSPVYEKEVRLSCLLSNTSGLLQLAHTTDGCGQGACCCVCVYAYVLGGVPEWHGSLFYFKLNKQSWMILQCQMGNQPETSRYLIASCSSIDFAFWKGFFAPDMYWYMVKLHCSSSQI